MRILALVMEAHGGQGGIARYNRDLLKALAQIDPKIEVVLLPLDCHGQSTGGGRSNPKSLSKKLNYGFSALKTFLSQGPFDVIFCGHLHLVFLAVLLSRIQRTSLWLQIHGIEAWKKPSVLLKKASEQADLVTAVSRYTRRMFLEWARLDPAKVRVLPNTVSENFKPGPKPQSLLKRYGLENKKILLTVSRLSSQEKYKGHDHVIRILPELRSEYPDLVYVIVGTGDDQPRLEAIAEEHGVKEKVKFVGEIDETELADHYRMADLFVMPSTGEGFGIVFLEALRCGIPVVGSSVAGSFDALLEGRSGRLVPPNDHEALRQAILESLDLKEAPPETAQRFSHSNFTRLVESLTKNRLAGTVR